MGLKNLIRLSVWTVLLAIVGGTAALVYFGVASRPLVASQPELTTEDIARAKQLKETYDPRRLKEREISRLKVTEKDLDILFRYMIDQWPRASRVQSRAMLDPGIGELQVTVQLPQTPLGAYLNLVAAFRETNGKPELYRVGVGRIDVGGFFLQPVLYFGGKLLRKAGLASETAMALDAVKDVQFRADELVLVYEWRSDVSRKIMEKGRSMLIGDQDRGRLIAYNDLIGRTAGRVNATSAPLTDFMAPVFDLAAQRSEDGGDPIAENRAAILALTMYVNGRSIDRLVGERAGERIVRPDMVKTTLRGRTDLPKHFLVSAALVALADSHLSNVVGLFKELDDAMGGSGFSFIDLLADRAGVRFAELGTASDKAARRVQQQMGGSLTESVFMPGIGDLNEGMMQKTFKQRYRDVDSAAYRAEKQEIERRIDACLLYRGA